MSTISQQYAKAAKADLSQPHRTETSSSAIAERPRCMVGLVMAKSGRLELGYNIYEHYRSMFNHCDVIGQQSNKNRRENAK